MLSRCIAPVESHFFVQTNFTAPVSTLPTQYGTAQLSVGRRTRTPNVFFSFYLLYYPVSVGAKLTAFYIAIDIRLCFLRSSFFFCLFLNWNSVRVLDPFVAVSERRGDSVTLSRHSGRFAGRRQVAAARVSTLPRTGSGEFRRLSLHSCRCSDLTCFFTTFPHFCFTSAKLGVVVVVVINSVIKGRQSSIEK